MKHVRKPLSRVMIDEIKAAVAEKEKANKDEEDKPVEGDIEEKSKSKDKDSKKVEGRDWKRNGTYRIAVVWFLALITLFIDERWLESLDMKIAVLINRDDVDPRDYGGKSYDEYESSYSFY